MGSVYRLLIVEDDQALLELFQRMAQWCYPNAQVHGFADGLLALRAYQQQPADLLITNYATPEIEGAMLIRTLRRYGATCPILAISGNLHDRMALRRAGATAYLARPFRLDSFQATVYGLLPASRPAEVCLRSPQDEHMPANI